VLAKYVKKPYKISNWSEYDKSLKQRIIEKTFEIDVFSCRKCGGPTKVMAFISDPREISKIMKAFKLHSPPPPRSAGQNLSVRQLIGRCRRHYHSSTEQVLTQKLKLIGFFRL
jgi:hypothetical protein